MPTPLKYTLAMFALTALIIMFSISVSYYLHKHKDDATKPPKENL